MSELLRLKATFSNREHHPDAHRAHGAGTLHQRDAHGTYRRSPDKRGPNEPCACGSGKKTKKCHPDGLQPRANRIIKGDCDACGTNDVEVIPARHDGLPGWKRNVCLKCIVDPKVLDAMLPPEMRPPTVPPAPPPSPPTNAPPAAAEAPDPALVWGAPPEDEHGT